LAKQGLELKTEYTNPPLGSFSLGTGSAGAKTQLDGTGMDTGNAEAASMSGCHSVGPDACTQ